MKKWKYNVDSRWTFVMTIVEIFRGCSPGDYALEAPTLGDAHEQIIRTHTSMFWQDHIYTRAETREEGWGNARHWHLHFIASIKVDCCNVHPLSISLVLPLPPSLSIYRGQQRRKNLPRHGRDSSNSFPVVSSLGSRELLRRENIKAEPNDSRLVASYDDAWIRWATNRFSHFPGLLRFISFLRPGQ